jgi:hypothetical protein
MKDKDWLSLPGGNYHSAWLNLRDVNLDWTAK